MMPLESEPERTMCEMIVQNWQNVCLYSYKKKLPWVDTQEVQDKSETIRVYVALLW